MDAGEAFDAFAKRYFALFKRHPVRMHAFEAAQIIAVLGFAWVVGGPRLLVILLAVMLGSVVLFTVIAYVGLMVSRRRGR
jgi:hypothetical protein